MRHFLSYYGNNTFTYAETGDMPVNELSKHATWLYDTKVAEKNAQDQANAQARKR